MFWIETTLQYGKKQPPCLDNFIRRSYSATTKLESMKIKIFAFQQQGVEFQLADGTSYQSTLFQFKKQQLFPAA